VKNGHAKTPPTVLVLADGFSIHTERWIEGLSRYGNWNLHLLSMSAAEIRPEISKIPQVVGVHHIAPKQVQQDGRNFQYLFQIPRLRRKIREINPSIISAVYLPSYGFIGALLKGSAKLVQFTVGGDVMIFPDQGLANKAVVKFTLARSNFVVCASEFMSNKLVQGFKYDRARILAQQYGVPDWVIEFPQQQKSYDFVSNRAWVENSNIDYILRIIKELPANKTALFGPELHNDNASALAASIAATARAIPGCELFGPLPYEENIDVVAKSRFLVSLTSSDGASLSVIEAMAVGTIPIVSDIPPNREWVEHGKNGFIIPLDNVEEAVKRFKSAMAQPAEEMERMVLLNKKIVSERGSLSKNMSKVCRVMENLERV
jgi:glycosyltransferase involved in cell wall biosynthesis